ncbi:MAG TPA: Gfo/Idh/MocA family oxidoreductase [Jatrophihabitans sp.]|jgi:predicted dehydrogenase|uniref:Gfo/Idh/MocA family protein n=1 Tax=Jatrophihabitans sp. TaxID=1932789 RepID=UPI002F12B1B1
MTAGMQAAIVGTGFIAGVHAHAVRAAGGEVAAVLGSGAATTASGVRAMGARRGAADLAELLAAPDVDVVHICTPNRTHTEMAQAALAAGKHVICEKPLATSVSDAQRLTELAGEAGRVASVPFVYRFYSSVREARNRIARDAAGPLWLLHGTYLQDWLSASDATNWRMDPALGGASRAFGDIGVHWCDLMEFTTGHRIVRLAAQLGSAYKERHLGDGTEDRTDPGTEDGAVVVFQTDRGAMGSVVVSQVTPGRKNRLWFSFDGPDASYSFDQEAPDALWMGARDQNVVLMRGTEVFGQPASTYSRLPAGHPQGYQDAFNAYVCDVYAAVAGHAPDGLPLFADGLRAAVLTQAVMDAAASQTWIEVPA